MTIPLTLWSGQQTIANFKNQVLFHSRSQQTDSPAHGCVWSWPAKIALQPNGLSNAGEALSERTVNSAGSTRHSGKGGELTQ